MDALWQVEFIDLELATAGFFVLLAVVLGFLMQRAAGGSGLGGAVLLGLAAFSAGLICLAGTALGANYIEPNGALIGLLAGMLLAGLLISWLLGRFVGGRSGRFMAAQWFSFCALCLIGYFAGDEAGLLTISLPCLLMFWVVFSRISRYTLPLRGSHQRSAAFRCLLTHAMGTNYPYYVIRAGKVEQRVPGSPFLQFFAGPGIVYTDPDQGAFVDNNRAITQIFGPGLNFTGVYEQNPRALDLRPQVRTFPVTALTSDGIPIHTQVSIAFRLRNSGPPRQAGQSFQMRQRRASQIATAEYAERRRQGTEQAKKHRWDGELVPLLVAPILQDIISHYGVDGLCEPLNPRGNPRAEIAAELGSRTRQLLNPKGVEMIDCWFDNLAPQDLSVLQRRIDNWRTDWEHRILMLMSQGRSRRAQQLEQARGQAELDILLRFSQIAMASRYDASLSQTALALRFIDCLGEVLTESEKQWPLPKSYEETLSNLRGELEGGQR